MSAAGSFFSDEKLKARTICPTPLDPEYWQGITHSYQHERNISSTNFSSIRGDSFNNADQDSGCSPQISILSPVNCQVPIGPTTITGAKSPSRSNHLNDELTPKHEPGVLTGQEHSIRLPNNFKLELRDAFYSVRSLISPLHLFAAHDPLHHGTISIQHFHMTLSDIGVVLSTSQSKIITTHFCVRPNHVDYVALSRYMALDDYEL